MSPYEIAHLSVKIGFVLCLIGILVQGITLHLYAILESLEEKNYEATIYPVINLSGFVIFGVVLFFFSGEGL